MNYKKVKMEYQYGKGRFNRTLLVREDINLIELGCAMCTAVRAEFEHCFLFLKGKTEFCPDVFLEDSWGGRNELPMKKYSLSDLGDKFSFWYDTGDDWLFHCKVYKKETELEGDNLAYLVDGVGQGIWEDNAWTLDRYLNGELDPECDEEDEEQGIYFPWNFEIEKLSDFDTAFNIEEEKEMFDDMLNVNIEQYLEGMHGEGHELEVEPRTQEVMENPDMDDDPGSPVNKDYTTAILETVDYHIKTMDFVNAKYQKLVKKYDDQTARNKIGVALMTEIQDILKTGRPFSESEYAKKIEKIK